MYVRGDINLWEKDIYVNYIYQFFINNNFIVYYLLYVILEKDYFCINYIYKSIKIIVC